MVNLSINLSLFLMSLLVTAQTATSVSYTLEECIAVALENNLDLQSSQLNEQTSERYHKKAKGALLPSLNGYYDIGSSSGRSIDPFTNAYSNQELTFSNARLSLSMTVFNGFKLLNTVKKSKLELEASNLEKENAKQTLILNVTLAYLQEQNAKDVLQQATISLESSKTQLERIQKQFDEGQTNPANFADSKGQLASDQLMVTEAENAVKQAHLRLATLMNITTPFDVYPKILQETQPYTTSMDAVYTEAINAFPLLQASQKKVEAAKKSIAISKANYLPEVSVFASAGTNYSSAASTFTATGQETINTGQFVTIDGQTYSVFETVDTYDVEKIRYQDQFENNLNTVVGVQVQIPLFNGFDTKHNVALEKIQLSQSILELEQTQQQLKQSIQEAYFDMESAYNRYESLKEQVAAYKEAYRVHEVRYNNGVANFLIYVTSKNNYYRSEVQLANAHYEYLLRCKILDYYRTL